MKAGMVRGLFVLYVAWLALMNMPFQASAAEPIKIGFGISLAGPLAAGGRSALLANRIWEEDVNAKGGLLGRPVKLIYYDDQSSPAAVPGIYAKLLDVDKVDLIIGGYGTNVVAPALPLAIQKNKVILGPFAVALNEKFGYSRYFAMHPGGPESKSAVTRGFFELAAQQNPKPTTVAIIAADAEATMTILDGARENAKKAGLKIVLERTYPPSNADFTPIVRAVQAAKPDVVLLSSYPLDSVGLVRVINEVGFKPKLIGGAMLGLPSPPLKAQLGPLLNGFVNYEFWLPVPSMENAAATAMLKKYQARAAAEGVDPVGFYVPPWAYATLQVLEQAITGTGSVNDEKIAEYMHKSTFDTAVGKIKFGKDGEWDRSRVVMIQFQGVKAGGVEQFKDLSTQVVVYPPDLKSGNLIYPFEKARD